MIELLNKSHDKDSFDCGKELLNNYLKHQAGQDIKRKLAVCYVLIDKGSHSILGYYTLSSNSIPFNNFPIHLQKNFPKSYQSIPTTLLGRLAVNRNYHGKGIGSILLIDALKRSFESAHLIGSFAVVVDPIDEDAERFYEKYGFIKLPDSKKMFIAIKTLYDLFDEDATK